jgi:cyclo(L-tyrosyl-L-tyrosyl) synthase
MNSQALTANCERNFDRREHCCFGISPFNSYFSEERIRELARWGRREFKSMHFFVPDLPAVYTLQAQGYALDKAEWKARRQAQYLKNKIRRALESISISNEEISEMILDWERLIASPSYTSLLNEVTELFETDPAFQTKCLEASRWVMNQKISDESELTDEVLRLAVKYFLCEIPLFADTAGIIEKNTSVFCYHQRVEFLEEFYRGALSYKPQLRQGFIVLKPLIEDTMPETDFIAKDQARELDCNQ